MNPVAKILVVDDEAAVRYFLEETLTDNGHQVTTAENGERALELITTSEFDLVLLDLKMGGIGGMEVLAALRQKSRDAVVIVLTAHASLETAVEALKQGAHDYLFKPCEPAQLHESVFKGLVERQQGLRHRELLARLEQSLSDNLEDVWSSVVERVVGLSGPSEPDELQERFLQRGMLVIDCLRHVITLDGQLLELSPTEFDLLTYLMNAAPHAVSPQELVREVQGVESEAWEARDIVRSHIYRIRQKIKSIVGDRDVIRNVRGVGYTICDGYE